MIELFSNIGNKRGIDVAIYGYYSKKADISHSMCVYRWLLAQSEIDFHDIDQKEYTQENEQNLREILKNTDILILPYTKIESSIDIPLLLLEGMASLCAVVTRKLGDIPRIYGESRFLVDKDAQLDPNFFLSDKLKYYIMEERQRLLEFRETIGIRTSEISNKFLKLLIDEDY